MLLGIGHYEFWAEIFNEFARHLEKNKQVILIKGKNKKNHTSWQKNYVQKKKWKGSVLVVLAQNLFYNWCLFYTNLSSDISIEK